MTTAPQKEQGLERFSLTLVSNPVKVEGVKGEASFARRSATPEDWRDSAGPQLRLDCIGRPGEVSEIAAVVATENEALRVRFVLGPDGPMPVGFAVEMTDESPTGSRRMRRALSRLGYAAQLGEVERLFRDLAVSMAIGEEWRQQLQRPGRAGRDDIEYAVWAQRYVDALEVDPRRPVKVLVDQDAKRGEHRTDKEVRAKVNRARDRGLLTRTTKPGMAGGELTDKARALLARLEGMA